MIKRLCDAVADIRQVTLMKTAVAAALRQGFRKRKMAEI
jgi:hypothetical protein